jgi:MoxR-like ATPase
MAIAETALRKGAILNVTWERNPRSGKPSDQRSDSRSGVSFDGRSPVKSNKTEEGITQKIILPEMLAASTVLPREGELWKCEVVRVTGKPGKHKGVIWVRPLERSFENLQPPPGVWVDPQQFKAMLLVLRDRRSNLMMQGPQGTGKSTLNRAFGKVLNWQYRKVSGGMIKKHAQMIGRVNAGTVGERLKFVWEDSQLTAALREAQLNPYLDFLIHVDEFPRIDEDARDAFLDILEGEERLMYLPNGDVIKVGDNVHFSASGNVGAGFTQRVQDRASRDRWIIFNIDFMPQVAELAHCMRLYPQCPKDELDRALAIVKALREESAQGKIPMAPSTRRSEGIAQFLSAGFTIAYAFETVIVNQYDGPLDKTEASDNKDGTSVKKITDATKVFQFVKKKLAA